MDGRSVLILMLPAFCECLVLVGIHSYLGIHVIKRKVIFVDLALAQIAALGTLIAFLFGIPPHTTGAYIFALFLTALGAAVFSLCRFRRSPVPQEAVIGLVYAIAAATAILLIDKAPHGAEHLKEILTGSILWVKWESVLLAAVVYAAVGAFHWFFRERFLAISNDSDAAWRSDINVRLWDFLFYFSFGVVITLSVNVAGVLIVFVFLVAPAILAVTVTDRLRTQLIFGWALGFVVTVIGLLLAYTRDLPTGPAIIAAYGVATVVVAAAVHIFRADSRMRAGRHVLIVALGFTAALGAMVLGGRWLGSRSAPARMHALTEATSVPREEAPTAEALVRELTASADLEQATRALAAIEDTEARTEVVLRALEIDGRTGALIALGFLKGNPPLFYRDRVRVRLARLMGNAPGFVDEEAWDSNRNREAVRKITTHFGLALRVEDRAGPGFDIGGRR